MIRKKSLLASVDSLRDQKVLIIGDMMLDHYMMGSVDRISPEAPVPVVRVDHERWLLGGAGNVAKNIADLGGDPLLIGMIGNDSDGQLITRYCEEAGLPLKAHMDPTRPTTK